MTSDLVCSYSLTLLLQRLFRRLNGTNIMPIYDNYVCQVKPFGKDQHRSGYTVLITRKTSNKKANTGCTIHCVNQNLSILNLLKHTSTLLAPNFQEQLWRYRASALHEVLTADICTKRIRFLRFFRKIMQKVMEQQKLIFLKQIEGFKIAHSGVALKQAVKTDNLKTASRCRLLSWLNCMLIYAFPSHDTHKLSRHHIDAEHA